MVSFTVLSLTLLIISHVGGREDLYAMASCMIILHTASIYAVLVALDPSVRLRTCRRLRWTRLQFDVLHVVLHLIPFVVVVVAHPPLRVSLAHETGAVVVVLTWIAIASWYLPRKSRCTLAGIYVPLYSRNTWSVAEAIGFAAMHLFVLSHPPDFTWELV